LDGGDAHASVPVTDAGHADAGPRLPLVDAGGANGCFSLAYELDSGSDADAAGDICGYVYACGISGTGLAAVGCQVLEVDPAVEGGIVPIPQMTCWLPQGAGCDEDAYAPGEGGAITILCTPCPQAGGRRPAGLLNAGAAPRGGALGAYLASLAFEEDAAIAAFERMGAELASLGAPASLVAEAERAARDEIRHARAMARLARERGRNGEARIVRARVRKVSRRSAASVAAENAAEGCVRETYGALVATWQARHAEDAGVRRTFERIARDEARHAALSWAVARWLEPQLAESGRKRVERARRGALRALRRTLRAEPPRELAQSAGLPSARAASALLDGMARELGIGSVMAGRQPSRASTISPARSAMAMIVI